ncbi:MAG: hypothetical protein GWN67_16855, partial [Phycisphaerae bacterium]|nr:hypothetical protein [Phycisphaerae bacterium]NIP54377.1 hypothetical protein [Phycisphaerae bacterium]NIS53236.1 hypothetical protein [Phycisphaerae bacterium]NIU10761.1 hypothetical protein [Phycisphaerae bacterium]NIU57996.1 hypothetical protein [Phycisphaerae bacterium]
YAGFGEANPNTRNIELYETILTGDLTGNDGSNFMGNSENCYHVVTGSGTNATSVLDGFTIVAGNANGVNWWEGCGAGLHNISGSPTLNNCTFSRNSAHSIGGGMYNRTGSNPILTNCTFTGNIAVYNDGGGMFNTHSSPTLVNCKFTGNSAYMRGGGMDNTDSSPTLTNCIFTGNSAVGAGKFSYGGGMYIGHSSNPILINCTFIGNSSTNGNALGRSSGHPSSYQLTNCVLRDGGGEIYGGEAATITINYSNVEGGWPGTGNIDDDPFFVDADGADNVLGTEDDNLRLLPGSPCINTGTNSTLPPLPATDLDGNPRIVDGIVDMGAYEGAKKGFVLSAESLMVPEGGTATFTVALLLEPVGTLDVMISQQSGDPDITVESGELLNFDSSNYAIPQTVTLAAAEDEDYLNEMAQIAVNATGFFTASVTVTEMDNESVPGVLYVDNGVNNSGANQGRSWSDAFTDLQKALGIAQEYSQIEEIRVAQGVYTPALPFSGWRQATFQLVNGVAVKGGYAGFGEPDPNARDIEAYETVLSGDLNGDDIEVDEPCDLLSDSTRRENSYHVVIAIGCDETTILDGFSITCGNANVPSTFGSGAGANDHGGGMVNSGNTKIINCVFIANVATGKYSGGGGMSSSGNPTLINCSFIGNIAMDSYSGSGGGISTYDNPTFINCTFVNNVARKGGGMFNSGNPTLKNCTFIRNLAFPDVSGVGEGGGAIYNDHSSERPILSNCKFISNSARKGGGIRNYESSPILTSCIFIENYAEYRGGGIFSDTYTCQVKVVNCTFSRNSAGICGGATYWGDESEPQLVNSIFWDNTATEGPQIAVDTYSLSVSFCNVQGGKADIYGYNSNVDWGDGNIENNPLFQDPDGDDNIHGTEDDNLRLSNGSPCIDAGDPNYIAEPNETDLDGKPRIIGDRIDMGAYEYGQLIHAEARIVPRTINLASKGNWITCYISLPKGYDVADIDFDSILLEDEIKFIKFSVDEQQQVATAKFYRSDVHGILSLGEVQLTINGQLTDGTAFEGNDIINVIDKGQKRN